MSAAAAPGGAAVAMAGGQAQPAHSSRVRHLSYSQNLTNALSIILIALPNFIFAYYYTQHCQPSLARFNERQSDTVWWMPKLTPMENMCRFGAQHPLIMANILMFINMDVLFWLASLVQNSTWLIDPYWTIIPLFLAHFYSFQPLAAGDPWRSRAVLFVVYVWSVRLTHSYFRREEWQFGAREDWRFSDLRHKCPRSWWWMSFFAAYVSQHAFLFGITAPIYAAVTHPRPPFGTLTDLIGLATSLLGIVIAHSADTTLRNFMVENERRIERGQPKILILQQGLWQYSRHPNYVGEQMMWWGLGIIAWGQGYGWMLVGPLLNSICLAVATRMVEERMLRNPARTQAYRGYQARTSVWIPMPKLMTQPAPPRHQD